VGTSGSTPCRFYGARTKIRKCLYVGNVETCETLEIKWFSRSSGQPRCVPECQPKTRGGDHLDLRAGQELEAAGPAQ